jgi:hypothetical protein
MAGLCDVRSGKGKLMGEQKDARSRITKPPSHAAQVKPCPLGQDEARRDHLAVITDDGRRHYVTQIVADSLAMLQTEMAKSAPSLACALS